MTSRLLEIATFEALALFELLSPRLRNDRLSISVVRIRSLTLQAPARTSVKPAWFSSARTLWHRGRRRSTSTSNTRTPVCAKTTAVFSALTVLPSEFDALVNKIVFGGAPARESISAVRNDRYASPTTEYWLIEPANSRLPVSAGV